MRLDHQASNTALGCGVSTCLYFLQLLKWQRPVGEMTRAQELPQAQGDALLEASEKLPRSAALLACLLSGCLSCQRRLYPHARQLPKCLLPLSATPCMTQQTDLKLVPLRILVQSCIAAAFCSTSKDANAVVVQQKKENIVLL